MAKRIPTDQRRQTAYRKVLALRAKADSVYAAGYADWADRLDKQAAAIEIDYGGFDAEARADRDNAKRAMLRRQQIGYMFDLVKDAEVRERFPHVRAWASAAIDELKQGGPLLGEGHQLSVTPQLRKPLDGRKLTD